MLEENQALQRQLLLKREKELESLRVRSLFFAVMYNKLFDYSPGVQYHKLL